MDEKEKARGLGASRKGWLVVGKRVKSVPLLGKFALLQTIPLPGTPRRLLKCNLRRFLVTHWSGSFFTTLTHWVANEWGVLTIHNFTL